MASKGGLELLELLIDCIHSAINDIYLDDKTIREFTDYELKLQENYKVETGNYYVPVKRQE